MGDDARVVGSGQEHGGSRLMTNTQFSRMIAWVDKCIEMECPFEWDGVEVRKLYDAYIAALEQLRAVQGE